MELDNTFTVSAPIAEVWNTLMDVERVAGCVPGAQVLAQLSADAYQVGMRVRLGPVTMQYRGQVEVGERDEQARRAVMHGKAKEARGQGTAEATVELRLQEVDDFTRGTVHADVHLSGRAAAMGQSVIGDVAGQIVDQFARNLEELLSLPADHERSGATIAEGVETAAAGSRHGGVERPPEEAVPGEAPVEQVGGEPAMTGGQVVEGPGSVLDAPGVETSAPARDAAVSGAMQSQPGPRESDRVAAGPERPWAASFRDEGPSLDGFALARGVVRNRVTDPNVVLVLLAVVALLAYRLGRRGRTGAALQAEDLERIAALLERD